jgi:branched-chain amino acid transport system substrate-binding protein
LIKFFTFNQFAKLPRRKLQWTQILRIAMRNFFTGAAFFSVVAPVFAQSPILIGQTADLSSVAGIQMKSFNAGANAYFNEVNRSGGVGGRMVKLISMDDGFSAEKAKANAIELIGNPDVVALFGPRGTDQAEAVIEQAQKADLAVVGAVTGADSVRSSPISFPVRASYRSEITRMLKNIATAQTSKIVVLVQDDKFGNPLFDIIKSEVAARYKSIQVVGKVPFDRKKVDLSDEAKTVVGLEPNAVIALCNPTSCGSFVKGVADLANKEIIKKPMIYQTSISDMYAQFEKIGAKTVAGSPYTQVVPNPMNNLVPVSKKYRDLMAIEKAPIDYKSFEGYLAARVMVHGLRSAKKITRDNVISALQGMGSLDMEGFVVSYKNGKNSGSDFSELVSLNQKGRIIH